MAWSKNCKTRYNNRKDIFEAFKARYKIKSCWDRGGEHSLIHLKGVLRFGKDLCYRSWRVWTPENHLWVDISDHGAYFKTADNRVIYASQPYGELEAITAIVKDWDIIHGLKVEVFGPEYSWYNEHSNLVLITLVN